MDLIISVLELVGVLISAGAWLCSLATTLMSSWLTLSNLLVTETLGVGLWETCVLNQQGTLECRPYDSLLGLRPEIKLARILMCTALGVGMLGILLAIPGLHLVNGCRQQLEDVSCKKALKATSGALCLVAGILDLIPVSYIAHVTVEQFFDESVPDMVPRWEFGDALFCGWTAGVLYLAAGILLLISCFYVQKLNSNRPVDVPPVLTKLEPDSMRIKSEYV
ncbi:putative claudin-24 [Oreochromis niloticus]|uniref:Claudin n=2 Tax=Oreochromis TaxID=8139 RepID=I3L063_ORENI|nr:putative claudin-24 [Oreochromis niloticus]XP_031612977.1 putative claudin-24 [Oreochromis aureus]